MTDREIVIEGYRKLAEGAGKSAAQHALSRPKARSRMTTADFDLIAWWSATWAGHWGRCALRLMEQAS